MSAGVVKQLLDLHVQSGRNHRCECGWRPKFPQSEFGWEGEQHRQHVAEVLAGPWTSVSGTRIEAVTRVVECDCIWLNHEATAREALRASDAVMFAPANLARVVSATGLSLQTVTEIARELRNA